MGVDLDLAVKLDQVVEEAIGVLKKDGKVMTKIKILLCRSVLDMVRLG